MTSAFWRNYSDLNFSKWKALMFYIILIFMCFKTKGWSGWSLRILLSYDSIWLGTLWAFQVAPVVKNLPANKRVAGSILGLGGSPGVGNGNLLQYSCLENSMDKGSWQATVHRVTESNTTQWLSMKVPYTKSKLLLYFLLCILGYLMWRTDSLEKTLMLGKNEVRRRGQQRKRWLGGITNSMGMSLSKLQE